VADATVNHSATAYAHVCDSYHKIDEFRAKLLGFLPVVSGVGALTLVNTDTGTLTASSAQLVFAGVFGALVTVGLFLYEVRGIRHCTFLIHQGRKLECELKLGEVGQFAHWDPDSPLRPMKVADFPRAAQVIYPTVFAAWVFVASYGLSSGLGWDGLPLPWVGVGAGVWALAVAWAMTERASRPEWGISEPASFPKCPPPEAAHR
jgi:hypothetical protein